MVELQEGSLQPWCCNKRWKVTYEIRGGILSGNMWEPCDLIIKQFPLTYEWLYVQEYQYFSFLKEDAVKQISMREYKLGVTLEVDTPLIYYY